MTVTRHRRTLLTAAALALTAAACGSEDDPTFAETGTTAADTSTTGAEAGRAAAGDVTIVAENTAFDTTALDATVGETITITFENRDDGIQHNLRVEGTSGGDAKTDIEEGPVTQTLDVTFDEEGAFEYRCDVHPEEMQGTITVTA